MNTAAIASTNDNAGSSKVVKKVKKFQEQNQKAQYRRDGMGRYTHPTNGLINRRGGGHWAANHSLTPGFFRSRLVTAARLLSSSSPSLSSRASTRSSSGKHLHTHLSTSSTNASPSLTRELEKKFSDRHVLIVASRRILPRPKRSNRSRTSQTQKRPRSRTLTAVHDAILADLVYPVEIVGKRMRTKEDGTKVLKIVLDEKERGGVDYRLDTYSEVYKRLTGKGVNFEFPVAAAEY